MEKEKVKKIFKHCLIIESAFIIILLINIAAYIYSPSNLLKTTIVIEVILLIIAKNYLKNRLIKKINK